MIKFLIIAFAIVGFVSAAVASSKWQNQDKDN